jgi:hypothetical protein
MKIFYINTINKRLIIFITILTFLVVNLSLNEKRIVSSMTTEEFLISEDKF